MSSDPLLRAVADGDTHCPDGVALARLGRLVRSVEPAPTSLAGAVVAATRHAPPTEATAETLPPALAKAVAAIAPQPVDLRPRVRAAIRARRGPDPRRVRIWLWVGAAHVAALVAVAVLGNALHDDPPASHDMTGGWAQRPVVVAPLPEAHPPAWTALPLPGADLLAPRRTAESRAAARRTYGGERSASAVACGLTWLARHPLPPEADDASRALVALAFLGEHDAQRARPWMPEAEPARSSLAATSLATGLLALAQVECALVTADPADQRRASDTLRRLSTSATVPGGLGVYAFLAVEEARAGGLAVPPRLVATARADLGRPLPSAAADTGAVGLATLARVVLGYRENPSTAALLLRLAERTPHGTPDPLGWWAATLAVRDAGGPAWDRWHADLQATLLAHVRDDGPGCAMVPATAVRHATSDQVATAAVILCLQAPYRTLALSPTTP